MTKMIRKRKRRQQQQQIEKVKGQDRRKNKQLPSNDNDETPVNDELKLSEDDEPTDDKSKGVAAKKGATKRTVPASGKKSCCDIREEERSK